MNTPSPARLFDVLDATWPAARVIQLGPWKLRQGNGGGQRVSATTVEGHFTEADISSAEDAMRDMNQRPLFMLRDTDMSLDHLLDARGYEVVDPVSVYLSPIENLTAKLPLTAAMPSWPPLAIQLEIWGAGGIGPARLAVMDRCDRPKTSIVGRTGDVPAGTAFAALDGDIAMVHAIEVHPEMRRHGVGRHLIQASANWASEQSGAWLSLAVTRANGPANDLYRALGLEDVARYHYRRMPEPRS